MQKILFQKVWCITCNWYVILFHGLCKYSSPIIINLHFLGKIAKISASIKQVYYSFFDIDIVNTWWETTFWKKVNDDNDMLIRIETVFVKYASWSLFMSSWNMAMILCKRILFLYMEFKSVVCFWRIVQIFCKWVEFVITASI